MQFLSRIFGKKPLFTAELAPEASFVAVGDIHGRMDLLDKIMGLLPKNDMPLIFAGDYVDRGEDSASVLRYLLDATSEDHLRCLKGNHEAMMLEFLEDPQRAGKRWLVNGGLQTLASFKVPVSRADPGGEELIDISKKLADAMGPDLIRWVADLPTFWTSGNVTVLHAGADPALPLDRQLEQTLLWGHDAFGKVPRTDGQWVIHGHTIVPEPISKSGVISIDTGAFATGKLTAASISPGAVTFQST